MSVQAMSWVIEYAPYGGNEFVVLLMLANHAHADGTGAHPSYTTLARECRMSRRQVIRVIELLASDGYLLISRGTSEWHTNEYTVVMKPGDRMTSADLPKRARAGARASLVASDTAMSPPSDEPSPPAGDIDGGQVVTFAPPASDIAMSPKPSLVKPSLLKPSAAARESESDVERQVLEHVMAVPVFCLQPRADVLAVYREVIGTRGPRAPATEIQDAMRFRYDLTNERGELTKPLRNWRKTLTNWFGQTRTDDAQRQQQPNGRLPEHPGNRAQPLYADPRSEQPVAGGVRRRISTI